MDYNVKIKIGDVELFESEDTTVKTPFITNIQLKSSTALESMAIGSTASDCLYFTIMNPYRQSFDGEKCELYISPQDDTSTLGLGEIEEAVGSETSTEVIDTNEVDGFDDTEDGEPLTPQEEAETEAQSAANTEALHDFFNGTPDTIVDVTTEEETEPTWIKLGSYYVFRQNNSTKDNSIRFECLDGFSKLNDVFKPSVAVTTLQNIYDDFRNQCWSNYGIEVDEFEFPTNANVQVKWNLDVSFRDSIGYLAGAVGGFATFGMDDTLGITFYTYNDTILLDDIVIKYNETSAGEMLVEGILCDRSINPYREDIIEVGSGASISFFNPFVTEQMLDDIFETYNGIRFVGGEVSLIWNENILSGQFIRIMSADEYANYLALNNALAETTDPAQALELKSHLNSLGNVLLVSNQTIDFTGDATSVITSVCDTEYSKSNKVKSPSDQVVRNLYAEMIQADYIDAKRVVTEGLEAEDAHIQDLVADSLQVGSINGNVIRNGSVLAAALSQEAVQTLSGNHVYYQPETPTGGTYLEGDTWYKTVIADSDTDRKVLHIWDGSEWVPSDFDAKLLRANTITAQEIASNTITANNINMNDLQTNIARIGDTDGQHVVIDNDSVDIMDGNNVKASFGEDINMNGTINIEKIGSNNIKYITTISNYGVSQSAVDMDTSREFDSKSQLSHDGIYLTGKVASGDIVFGNVSSEYFSQSTRYSKSGQKRYTRVAVGDGDLFNQGTDGAILVYDSLEDDASTVAPNFKVTRDGKITVEGHDSPIGTYKQNSGSSLTTSAGVDTLKEGCNLTLGKGVWMVYGYWQFNTRSGTGTSNRQILLRLDSTNFANQRVMYAARNYGTMTINCPVQITNESGVVRVMGSCSEANQSGYLDACQLRAVRIA